MLKGLIIFGAGVYTGVYVAQNYQDAIIYFCEQTSKTCNDATGDQKKRWWDVTLQPVHIFGIIINGRTTDTIYIKIMSNDIRNMDMTKIGEVLIYKWPIEKVEDPKVLFSKMCDMVKEKMNDLKGSKDE